jgi:hypothetical protein
MELLVEGSDALHPKIRGHLPRSCRRTALRAPVARFSRLLHSFSTDETGLAFSLGAGGAQASQRQPLEVCKSAEISLTSAPVHRSMLHGSDQPDAHRRTRGRASGLGSQAFASFARADVGVSLRANQTPLAMISAAPPTVHASGAVRQNNQSSPIPQSSALYSKGAMEAAWPCLKASAMAI